jgi:SAM-dependent methyltransferase
MAANYVGSELELFANAHHWKAYWSRVLKPYIGKRVLDVGAGIGGTARVLGGSDPELYLALEPDAALARKMRDQAASGVFPPNFGVVVGTTRDLAVGQLFDTILYIDVLEHIADDREELARAAVHLAAGGRIVVLAPAHQWLYSEFDAAVGHVRRYDKSSLPATRPDGLELEKLFYLDSVGLLASLGNRLLLKASAPTTAQIQLWDGWMVPASRLVDRLTGFLCGKTIVAIYRRPM